jgi:hypothetical protein
MDALNLAIKLAELFVIPVFTWLVFEIRQMRKSVDDLNIHVAVVIERVDHHEHRISKIEEKI